MAGDEDQRDGVRFVAYRLSQIEKRLDRMESHFDERLSGIQGSIGNLAFVRKDVYDTDQKAREREMAGLVEKVESARALAMWALGTTLTTVALVGTLIGILRMAGA